MNWQAMSRPRAVHKAFKETAAAASAAAAAVRKDQKKVQWDVLFLLS